MKIVELERKDILERIKYENDLIHQRMSWLGTFQGLLFGAVAFAWKDSSAGHLVYIASIMGIFVSVSIGYAIYRANISINNASNHWDSLKPEEYKGLDVEGFRSSLSLSWLMPGSFVPKIFIFSWIMIAVIRFNPSFLNKILTWQST